MLILRKQSLRSRAVKGVWATFTTAGARVTARWSHEKNCW